MNTPTPQTDPRTVILVEGVSDQVAVETVAARSGWDLTTAGVTVLPMGGATNIGHFVERFGPHGLNVNLAGLCDEGEVGYFLRALVKAGVVADVRLETMGAHGFYVCSKDLEDEMIRALGVASIEDILDQQGDLRSFRIFQRQPAQRGKSDAARLRRFLGTRRGRKINYGSVLANALDVDRLPAPLAGLLCYL